MREALVRTTTVRDDGHEYRFRCRTFEEYMRAATFAAKEPGTVELLRSELRAGDVFYDVGANVGIYTIPAALRVGDRGCVFAFEPHLGNAYSLLDNIRANGLERRVTVVSSALHEAVGFFEFRYRDLGVGSSMSQLESSVDAFGEEFVPDATELKFATTVDELVRSGATAAPAVVKIDVDGNELQVLRGMSDLLRGGQPPRAVQVEVNVGERDELLALMDDCGFGLAHRHHTEYFSRRVQAGDDPESLPFNGVFRPVG
jgi:FkbM family methyltransferase